VKIQFKECHSLGKILCPTKIHYFINIWLERRFLIGPTKSPSGPSPCHMCIQPYRNRNRIGTIDNFPIDNQTYACFQLLFFVLSRLYQKIHLLLSDVAGRLLFCRCQSGSVLLISSKFEALLLIIFQKKLRVKFFTDSHLHPVCLVKSLE
jgi:hypothetical protein